MKLVQNITSNVEFYSTPPRTPSFTDYTVHSSANAKKIYENLQNDEFLLHLCIFVLHLYKILNSQTTLIKMTKKNMSFSNINNAECNSE